MIVVAFDPGSKETAWARITSGARGRPKYYAHGMLASTNEAIALFIRSFPPDWVVAVETIDVYGSGDARHAVRMKPVAKTSEVAGRISMAAHVLGHRVIESPAIPWRQKFCGNGRASNDQIEATLRVVLEGMPKPQRSNEHHRDAMGLGCVALRTIEIEASRSRASFPRSA